MKTYNKIYETKNYKNIGRKLCFAKRFSQR